MERRLQRFLSFYLIWVLLLFAACCDRKGVDTGGDLSETIPETCYRWVAAKDTIMLSFGANKALVDGRLSYRFYEKDKSNGTIKGTVNGDTLFVNYSFFSEGMFSHREVAFLRKGNSFVLGAGEVSTEGNRNFFTDRKEIRFNTGVELEPVDCHEIEW